MPSMSHPLQLSWSRSPAGLTSSGATSSTISTKRTVSCVSRSESAVCASPTTCAVGSPPKPGHSEDPWRLGELESRGLSRDHRQRPPRTGPGARAGSAEEDDLDRVPAGALGGSGRGRFLYRGCLDQSRSDAVRGAL